MAGLSLLGVAGIVAAIVLLRVHEHAWAAGAAFFPTGVIAAVFLVAMIK